jgi:5-methyltetrahydrofolate--homocysteine methyltransferase
MDDARRGMEIVGERFSSGEYFIPDLVYSGEILREISDMVKPVLTKGAGVKRRGKVIIGTVSGDIHDIGKDIVVFMLDVNGFEVYDLGIDVPAQKFVDKVKEVDAKIIGLSGFLTLAFDSMKTTIAAIKEAYPQEDIKIMIGGGQINEDIKKYTGADAYGKDAMAAVSIARQWTPAS